MSEDVVKSYADRIVEGDEINVGGTWMVVQGAHDNEENFIDLDLGNESLLSISKSAVIEVRRSLPKHVGWLLKFVDSQDRAQITDEFRRAFPEVINNFRDTVETDITKVSLFELFPILSGTDANRTYNVKHYLPTGEWTCDCPAGKYKPEAHCKHVKEARDGTRVG